MDVKDLTFAVPWGIIAAKAWGDPCAVPVLLLHGIQDNAGSFDNLIPLLPNTFYYLGLDLPGHGLSSRMPKGFRLDLMDYVLSINRVVCQLSWKKFILIGHSLGGQLAQYYAAMYPDQVEKLITLDVYGPTSVALEYYLEAVRANQEKLIKIENKMVDAEPPSYTRDIALEKMVANRRTPITKEAAEKIMVRNLKKGKDGYYFSLDQRLKLAVHLPLSHTQHRENYKRIICPFLFIITRHLYEALKLDDPQARSMSLIAPFFNNPKFQIVIVDGYHDVHNTDPDLVAPYINQFLLLQTCSL